MTDQVSFDPYGGQSQQPKRSPGSAIFKLAFMFILAIVVFRAVGGLIGGRRDDDGINDADLLPPVSELPDTNNQRLPDASRNTIPSPDYSRNKTGSGDWEIEDMDVAGNGSSTVSKNDKVNRGDWTLEEVEGTTPTNTDRNLRPSKGKQSKPSTTKNGDWEITVD